MICWTQAAGNKSESARLLCARGELRAGAGRWNEAVVEFSNAAGLDPNDEESSADLVLVLLEAGRNEECRQRCHELLAQAATNKVGVLSAATLAKVSLLLPVDGPDLELACELAWTSSAQVAAWGSCRPLPRHWPNTAGDGSILPALGRRMPSQKVLPIRCAWQAVGLFRRWPARACNKLNWPRQLSPRAMSW